MPATIRKLNDGEKSIIVGYCKDEINGNELKVMFIDNGIGKYSKAGALNGKPYRHTFYILADEVKMLEELRDRKLLKTENNSNHGGNMEGLKIVDAKLEALTAMIDAKFKIFESKVDMSVNFMEQLNKASNLQIKKVIEIVDNAYSNENEANQNSNSEKSSMADVFSQIKSFEGMSKDGKGLDPANLMSMLGDLK